MSDGSARLATVLAKMIPMSIVKSRIEKLRAGIASMLEGGKSDTVWVGE